MIILYGKKEASFTSNGIAVLHECQSCIVEEKLNGSYELSLTYPLSKRKAKLIEPFQVIKAAGQLFRIYHVEKDSRGHLLQVNARHIFYDLSYAFIEELVMEDVTGQGAVNAIMAEYDGPQPFSVTSTMTATHSQYVRERSVADALFLVINRWRGELYRDNFNISLKEAVPNDQGVTIRYGKNIAGIKERIQTDKVLTAIYPVGANRLTLPEKVLTNAQWDSAQYPDFKMVKKVSFQEAEHETTLRDQAYAYLQEHASLGVHYDVDLVQLDEAKAYQGFGQLLQVNVGDTVTVSHDLLGIDFKIKVIKVARDLLKGINTKVELGEPLYTLDRYMEEFRSSVDESIEKVDSSIGGIQHQLDDLHISYTIVKNLTVTADQIQVTYEVEKGSTHQFSANYDYTTDGSGKITSIQLDEVFSELLLKEVSILDVGSTSFDITYVDGTTAVYNYTSDGSGRISSIERVEGGA
ncbi:phage tail spike protein [Salisediminibacterium selenitireducens]|uniref:Phage minor structural protein n=1 Tax=Bacillus selenitireducens (strain ATCC 700615 / DSM 15326 / MLS10) TaxID=439292 RepID=D6XZF8_BACIE|nr:phage tail spike protein [Salisediminibacterium selenitireducens]ADH98332.1 phage minor structural protein [[Bacillus] selenitireducens MLS10]